MLSENINLKFLEIKTVKLVKTYVRFSKDVFLCGWALANSEGSGPNRHVFRFQAGWQNIYNLTAPARLSRLKTKTR